jgi:hypothetical protein
MWNYVWDITHEGSIYDSCMTVIIAYVLGVMIFVVYYTRLRRLNVVICM